MNVVSQKYLSDTLPVLKCDDDRTLCKSFFILQTLLLITLNSNVVETGKGLWLPATEGYLEL